MKPLHNYLHYAEFGSTVLYISPPDSRGPAESDFGRAVAHEIEQRGHTDFVKASNGLEPLTPSLPSAELVQTEWYGR